MADRFMNNLERTDYPFYEPTIDTNGGRKAADRLAEHLAAARVSSTALYGGRGQGETRIYR